MKWQNFIFLATHKSMFFSTKSILVWEKSSINLHSTVIFKTLEMVID